MFGNKQQTPLLFDRCGHRLDVEMTHQLAALIEKEAALFAAHQLERCAAHEDQFGRRSLKGLRRPVELGRIIAVQEHERLAQGNGIERIDPSSRRHDEAAFAVADIFCHRNRRIERPASYRGGNTDAAHRHWPVDLGNRAPFQILVEPSGGAARLQSHQLSLDLFEQIGLGYREKRALLAVIPRMCRCSDEAGGDEVAQRSHNIGLPTPNMRGRHIQPIAA